MTIQKTPLSIKAYAKANLSLNITGLGKLHTLDSVMVTLDAFDTVTIAERDDGEITTAFDIPGVDEVDNTAYKAAALVKEIVGIGFDIQVKKGIPVGAGLGGSSADGAAVIRALDRVYSLSSRGVDTVGLALSVGSDVPFMLIGGAARVTGVGENVERIDCKLPLHAVGVMCGYSSTREVYKKFDELYGAPFCPTDNRRLTELLEKGDESALGLFDNALFSPAANLLPEIEKAKSRFAEVGGAACLTGSGGMVLGWFTDLSQAKKAAALLGGESNGVYLFGVI